jgi:hypothetical protein
MPQSLEREGALPSARARKVVEKDLVEQAGTGAPRYNKHARGAGRAPERPPSDWEDMMSLPRIFGRVAWTRISSCLALLACLSAITAAAANAGTYVIGDCPSAANHATTPGPWSYTLGLRSPQIAVKQGCSGGPGDWTGVATIQFPYDLTGVGATTAGTNLTIRHARLWFRMFGSDGGGSIGEIEATNETGGAFPITYAVTSNSEWDTSGGPLEVDLPAADQAKTLYAGERCTEPNLPEGNCSAGGTQPTYEGVPVYVQLYGAELTLEDNTPPTITLTSTPPEGSSPASGLLTMGFSANDPDSGLAKAELLSDGKPVAVQAYASSCTYTQLLACPATRTEGLSVLGTALPEGAHQLAVRVTDAAGNSTLSAARTVYAAGSPIPNGDPCPTPAIALSEGGHSRQVTLSYGHSMTITGRLGCGTQPISNASIELSTTSTIAAPTDTALRTAADGSFTYKIAAGTSRRLTLGYRAYSNQDVASAQASLQVNVTPRLKLSIAPHHTHNGGTIHWRGRLEGGPYPPSGVPLLIQVKAGKRWQTFDQVVTHHGSLKYRYTFHRTTRATTYAFRISLPSGGAVGYPYATGASPKVKVRVR